MKIGESIIVDSTEKGLVPEKFMLRSKMEFYKPKKRTYSRKGLCELS